MRRKHFRAKLYRLNNRDKIREYQRNWHKRPEVRKRHAEYAIKYREKRREYMRAYYKLTEKKRASENRTSKIYTVLNGKMIGIRGLLKRPYPNPPVCELCGQPNMLKYHHWMDTKFILASPRSKANPLYVPGIWICQPCDNFCHKLMDYPLLAKKWEILKAEAEVYVTKLSSQVHGRVMGE